MSDNPENSEDGVITESGRSARIEDWRLVRMGQGHFVLIGRAFGRSGIADGRWMHSSLVIGMSKTTARTYSGTVYALGEPYPETEDLPERICDTLMMKMIGGHAFRSFDELAGVMTALSRLRSPESAASVEEIASLMRGDA